MANIRLIHWNGPEGRERKLRLASLGHHVEFDDVDDGSLMRVLRGSVPDAYVIDLTRMPSLGRTAAMWLRSNKSTRHIPIVFADGDPEKVKKVRELLPDATFATWPRLNTAIAKAIATPLKNPVVPPSSIYTGRPLVEKLGVKPGMRVCVSNAPPGFTESLTPVPAKVTYTARPDGECGLFLVFTRSRREVAPQFMTLAKVVDKQTLWIAWPKKASRIKSDVDGNFVRESGLASGWVDFKVCAFDDTWSGLAFKRRK